MADFDTSSYQNKVLPLNPLDTFGKAATLQNTLNQNQLFQQMFKTNKAVSDIYKRAVKPDGTLDMDQLRDEVSKNPDAAYGLAEVYKGAQGLQQGQIQTDTSALENKLKHYQAVGSFIAPLVALGDKATSTDVLHQLSAAGVAGLASPKEQGEFYAMMPRTPDNRIDESKIPAWSQHLLLTLQDKATQLQATMPAPNPVNTPQGTRFVRTPQFGAPSDAGGFIPNVPGPTQKTFNPATQREEFVGVLPNGGIGAPQAQGAAGGGMGGQPPAQAAFAPGTPAGPALGAQEAASSAATFAAGQGNSLQARADQVPTTKSILGNLEAELDTPGFSTGPGTKSMADLTKFLNTQGGLNIRTEGMAAREQFGKLAGMLAQSQFQALGGTGTDAKLDATTLTSPNSELTKLGNKGIIAMLKGNEDAIAAKNRAWQAWQQQNGPQSYGQFSTQFNKSYDPRVFQAQYLSDADKKKMLSSMSQKEINALVHSANFARQNGWIQ